ncbi:hypothetical protein [Streptomyces sp. NPDC048248]|uniref:hypothetical protein n=1 Tax=Streptomyces sp. NPDC048248 TaxID=3365523 RepID=UPI003721D3EA
MSVDSPITSSESIELQTVEEVDDLIAGLREACGKSAAGGLRWLSTACRPALGAAVKLGRAAPAQRKSPIQLRAARGVGDRSAAGEINGRAAWVAASLLAARDAVVAGTTFGRRGPGPLRQADGGDLVRNGARTSTSLAVQLASASRNP